MGVRFDKPIPAGEPERLDELIDLIRDVKGHLDGYVTDPEGAELTPLRDAVDALNARALFVRGYLAAGDAPVAAARPSATKSTRRR